MDFVRKDNIPSGVISGLAAGYWFCFSFYWVFTYLYGRKHLSNFLPSMDKSYYVSSVLYQVTAVLFFTVDCVYECTGSSGAFIALQVCFILYLPMAYVMGMGWSLGFGTLHVETQGRRIVVLVVTWVLAFLVCFLHVVLPAFQLTAGILLVAMFLCQVLIACQTLHSLQLRYTQCTNNGYAAVALSTHKSIKRLLFTLLLLILLFLISITGEIVSLAKGRDVVIEVLWCGFVVVTAVVNGWVMRMLRLKPELEDVNLYYSVLPMLNSE